MASPAMRISRFISRSWSSSAGISRSLAVSSNVMQSRAYSEEGQKDIFSISSAPESEGHQSEPISSAPESESQQSEPSPSFDSPSGIPLSDGFPNSGHKHFEQAGVHNNDYYRNSFPRRNFPTARGVYKAIIVGEIGQLPVQKILKSGKSVTIFSVGTGGMYNNRRPFEGESPQEFAERSYTQWHRVAVYQERIAGMVMQRVKIGSQVYLEGNIESRIYNDPNSGAVKRIREVAVRNNGILMFMDGNASTQPPVRVRDEPFTSSPLDPVNEKL